MKIVNNPIFQLKFEGLVTEKIRWAGNFIFIYNDVNSELVWQETFLTYASLYRYKVFFRNYAQEIKPFPFLPKVSTEKETCIKTAEPVSKAFFLVCASIIGHFNDAST